MRLAVTADLHWGHSNAGDAATRELVWLAAGLAPDVFAIAGDVGEGEYFPRCLELFAALDCPRLVIPGNHDLWTRHPLTSSLLLYEKRLPRQARDAGFHYLDQAPYVTPDGREAVVGSINWYDYSFADPTLEAEYPEVRRMYREKLFPRGRHNDGRFVQLGMTDEEFTGLVVERFRAQLAALPASVERIVALQHHPPVRELFYPSPAETPEQRFWLAYAGNRRMEEAVLADPRITTIVSGHTHAAREEVVAGKRAVNVGGDYHWKRLVLIDTDSGDVRSWSFGQG